MPSDPTSLALLAAQRGYLLYTERPLYDSDPVFRAAYDEEKRKILERFEQREADEFEAAVDEAVMGSKTFNRDE